MIKNLKQSFFQTFSLTLIWVTLLSTLFFHSQAVSIELFWHFIGIAGLSGFLFGIVYDVLWNYLTLAFGWNVLIGASSNLLAALAAVWLYSESMFQLIMPWIGPMLIVEITLHTLVFYLYANMANKKQVEALNQLIEVK